MRVGEVKCHHSNTRGNKEVQMFQNPEEGSIWYGQTPQPLDVLPQGALLSRIPHHSSRFVSPTAKIRQNAEAWSLEHRCELN